MSKPFWQKTMRQRDANTQGIKRKKGVKLAKAKGKSRRQAFCQFG